MNMPRWAFPQYACSIDALPRATGSIIWHITASDLIMFIHRTVTRRQAVNAGEGANFTNPRDGHRLVKWWPREVKQQRCREAPVMKRVALISETNDPIDVPRCPQERQEFLGGLGERFLLLL
jgi:hypothetical protein